MTSALSLTLLIVGLVESVRQSPRRTPDTDGCARASHHERPHDSGPLPRLRRWSSGCREGVTDPTGAVRQLRPARDRRDGEGLPRGKRHFVWQTSRAHRAV
jgi:hypothetical protein